MKIKLHTKTIIDLVYSGYFCQKFKSYDRWTRDGEYDHDYLAPTGEITIKPFNFNICYSDKKLNYWLDVMNKDIENKDLINRIFKYKKRGLSKEEVQIFFKKNKRKRMKKKELFEIFDLMLNPKKSNKQIKIEYKKEGDDLIMKVNGVEQECAQDESFGNIRLVKIQNKKSKKK